MGSIKRITFLWVFLLVLSWIAASGVAAAEEGGGKDAGSGNSGLQLKVNRKALMQSEDLQVRMDAASVMLYSGNRKARNILLGVLSEPNNPSAVRAVCRALKQSRNGEKELGNKQEFIEALIEALKSEKEEISNLAAETLLVFDYDKIRRHLTRMVNDDSLSVNARKNVIYALKLQPDMDATFELIKLLDDENEQIVSAAEQALNSLGIPVVSQPEQRKLLIREMKQKGKDSFFRNLRIRQQAQVSALENKVEFWKGKYLEALEKLYGYTPEEKRGEFLAELLKSSEPELRLWALEKIYQGRIGTAGQLPSELEPMLVELVSDPDKRVRLKTARVLALMSEINSAQQLLRQVKKEPVPEVKTQLFTALGVACHYAFSPNSGIELPGKVREQTLELAGEFLMQQDTERARKGAEVSRKLIEQDSTSEEKTEKYLKMILRRYRTAEKQEGKTLDVELLNIMASLCARQNPHSGQAAEIYRSVFIDSLDDENESVRLAAMKGLTNIDRTAAMRTFRKKLINDPGRQVQQKLIELAGKVGGEQDLQWLAKKAVQNPGNEAAWSVMLGILKDSSKKVNVHWFEKFTSDSNNISVSDQQFINFLQIVEQKSKSAKDRETLTRVREKLVKLYQKTNKTDKAAQTLGKLLSAADTGGKKNEYFVQLLKIYLQTEEFGKVKDLLNNRLLGNDIRADGQIIEVLEKFIENSGNDKVLKLLDELNKIKVKKRPVWEERLSGWNQSLTDYQQQPETEDKEVTDANQPAPA